MFLSVITQGAVKTPLPTLFNKFYLKFYINNYYNVVNGVLTAPWVMTDWKIKISRNANLVVNN